MLPRHIALLCLLCPGLILNGMQFIVARRKKKMNNYELLVAHSSALKLLCIITLLVLVILALNGDVATEPFCPGHPDFGALWCTLSLSINHMLFVSIDRILIIKIPIKYHMIQQTKKRYCLFAFNHLCNLLCGTAAFTPIKLRRTFILTALAWFAFAFTFIIIIHILVLKRLVSKKCMLHILKVNNKRVMVGECTPREKKIINSSLWSTIPFVVCNLPFCLANICGHYSLYLEMAVLLDVGLVSPSIWFAFSHYRMERSVAPSRNAHIDPAIFIEGQNGAARKSDVANDCIAEGTVKCIS